MNLPIPKMLHQLWIGPKKPPTVWMQTWKDQNPDFIYILWDEERLLSLDTLPCKEALETVQEINGKADIYRWFILYTYGGYFVDADSVCMSPLANDFNHLVAFACYENEKVRPGLIATTVMGFAPKHPLIRMILNTLETPEYQPLMASTKAWISVGPGILTETIKRNPQHSITLLPSHVFLPKHHTGIVYQGHGKVYGFHYWCSSYQSYEWNVDTIYAMNMEWEEIQMEPEEWVSVIVSCQNVPIEYIAECLISLQSQEGRLGIELVWVNQGSLCLSENTAGQMRWLKYWEQTSRHVRIRYLEKEHWYQGITSCTCELIFKMEADHTMVSYRLHKQREFMQQHPTLKISGGQKKGRRKTPLEIIWDEWDLKYKQWINSSTLCFRREAFQKISSENDILKQAGLVRNMPDVLVNSRHPLLPCHFVRI